MQVWYAKTKNVSGKRSIVFSPAEAEQPDDPLEISCGQCIGCRLERSRQWATRCLHEASLYDQNCFITLTFSDEGLDLREKQYIEKNKKRAKRNNSQRNKNKIVSKFHKMHTVPDKQSIHTPDLQLFMKRLRKKYGADIRFFACGEYGDENDRPHYHACLFNFNFPDRKQIRETPQGHKLFISESLQKLWPYGHSTIGQVTFDSAAYVARYVMKKINGSRQEKHYQKFNKETWEIVNLKPEFVTMSRGGHTKNGGIGFKWFEQYNKEVYDNDYCIVNGKKVPAPKFYDNKLETMDPFHYDYIKEQRLNNLDKHNIDNTPERLEIREKVKKRRLTQLTRGV